MGYLALVLLIAGSLLFGFIVQAIGRARQSFEWEIATIGALYGASLSNALLGPTLGLGMVFAGPACAGAHLSDELAMRSER